MSELRVRPRGPLRGALRVPGDKSISHRSVMLSAIAEGDTRIRGLLRSEDVRATMTAFRALGVTIRDDGADSPVAIEGRGVGSLRSPGSPLDLGNSGTSMRLLSGLFAGLPLEVELTGDASLSRRPMRRIMEPLAQMGAEIVGTAAGTAPLLIRGRQLRGIRYALPLSSAQVKSAVLLAGLFAAGETWVKEPQPTRDHTERMLPAFGVPVPRDGDWMGVAGGAKLKSPGELEVPGDLSSAAFFLVGALIVEGSELTIENIGVNPTRTGILDLLAAMGADITIENRRSLGAEPVADLRVRASRLTAIEVRGKLIPRAIDEIPALCVAAARAEGVTVIREAEELRRKESDRIAGMVQVLTRLGVAVRELPDGLAITGPATLRAAELDSNNDHRLAMAAAMAGLAAPGETVIHGAEFIATSFPGFETCLTAATR